MLLWILSINTIFAEASIPKPANVVVVILENHGYSEIIGPSAAPFINSLVGGNNTALLSNFYAIEHPSQPNYLDLFSGGNQGVTDDQLPQGIPFATDNLASALIAAGESFATYSEDLPATGSLVFTSGDYARRHNPASYWQGNGKNQVPPECNKPFSAFPKDFSTLPTVSFVVPNVANDMHDGADPERITRGDKWVREKLGAYAQWAASNNGLLIITFDEDDYCCANQIATLFVGEKVNGGTYNEPYNLFSLLRTIEDMYGLAHSGAAASASPISECWEKTSAETDEESTNKKLTIWPNPAMDYLEFRTSNPVECLQTVQFFDTMGMELPIAIQAGNNANSFRIDVSNLPSGLYCFRCCGAVGTFTVVK